MFFESTTTAADGHACVCVSDGFGFSNIFKGHRIHLFFTPFTRITLWGIANADWYMEKFRLPDKLIEREVLLITFK